ncbi:hypothetical protein D3C87_2088440 [compost metagenome]
MLTKTIILLKPESLSNLKNLSKQKYVKAQENGIQIKNNHSSIGKPATTIPSV